VAAKKKKVNIPNKTSSRIDCKYCSSEKEIYMKFRISIKIESKFVKVKG